MQIYLVGGAVRDRLLGYPSKDSDWVVVGASAEQMLALNYQPVGADFPVFLHPETKEEYALARTERKTGKGYQGFSFYAAEDVTLEQDLSRRDLTINAIAQAQDGTLIDPYHGQRDIQKKVLRHVSSAFSEDPLRVLRVARFAARYHHLGFSVAEQTLELMRHISAADELQHLSIERIWQEIERALMERSPLVFFEVLEAAQALQPLMPTLQDLLHNLTTLRKPACESSTIDSLDSAAKRIAWLFYISQITNPADAQQENSAQFCDFIRCPNKTKYLITQTVLTMQLLKSWEANSAEQKLQFIQKAGVMRDQQKLLDLLEITSAISAQQTDQQSLIEASQALLSCVSKMTAIDHKSLIEKGFKGAELGREISRLQLEACASYSA